MTTNQTFTAEELATRAELDRQNGVFAADTKEPSEFVSNLTDDVISLVSADFCKQHIAEEIQRAFDAIRAQALEELAKQVERIGTAITAEGIRSLKGQKP